MKLSRALLTLAVLCGCTASHDDIAGGSSDQGNALSAIRLVIVDPDGKPTRARIQLLPAQWMPGDDTTNASAHRLVEAGELVLIDSLKPQDYRILADGPEGKLTHVVRPSPGQVTTIRLQPSLNLQGWGIPGSEVRILGTHLAARCDASGRYSFDSLPSGAAELHIAGTGDQLKLDSLLPATTVYLAPKPDSDPDRIARIDSIILQSPQIYPAPGTYPAQVIVAPWHPLRDAIIEQSPSMEGPWSTVGTSISISTTTTFWLRARHPATSPSKPVAFTYAITPAKADSTILPLVASIPTGLLNAFVPDSVSKTGDTLHIHALVSGCDSLPAQGIRGHLRSDTLDIYRELCPQTAPTQIHLRLPGATSLLWVYTIQPKGMTFPLN